MFGLAHDRPRTAAIFVERLGRGPAVGIGVPAVRRAYARQYYLAALRTELAILGPAVVFAAVFAFEFSRLLFGPSWDRAAVIAQLLAFSAWRNITGHTTGSVLLSHGRPDLQLRWTTCALLLSLTYFFVGRPWGIEGVVTATAILDMTGWTIRHTMANRLLDLKWSQFARALSPLWFAHAMFLVVMVAIRYAIVGFVPGAWGRVALGLPLGLIAYLGILRVVCRVVGTLRGTVEKRLARVVPPVITACMIAHATSVSTTPATASTA